MLWSEFWSNRSKQVATNSSLKGTYKIVFKVSRRLCNHPDSQFVCTKTTQVSLIVKQQIISIIIVGFENLIQFQAPTVFAHDWPPEQLVRWLSMFPQWQSAVEYPPISGEFPDISWALDSWPDRRRRRAATCGCSRVMTTFLLMELVS